MRRFSSLPVQCAARLAGRGLFAAFLAGAGLSNGRALAADALSSPWSSSPQSAVRLIASGGLEGGVYHAAVEVKLDPGTLTYWRTPGDAGVPPVFAFAGSTNLAKVRVYFPAPKLYEEGKIQSYGYKNDVIFPLDVLPKKPGRPLAIALDLHYATCDRLCLPAEAKVRLYLRPRDAPGAEAALIAAARAEVPKIVESKDGHGFSVTPITGTASATWHVRFSPSPGPTAELFAEGPHDYYFDTTRAGTFRLVLAQKPRGAKGRIPVTLTLVDGQHAYQSTVGLDVPASVP